MNYGTKRLRDAREYIARHWREESDAQMANELNTTPENIAKRRKRLGLRRTAREVLDLRAKRIFRYPALCNFISQHWEEMSDMEIAERWRGTTPRIVAYHRRKIGLRRR